MPYDNQYNRDIANMVLMNNKRYIDYLENTHQNILGSGVVNNASKCECGMNPCQCGRGLGMSGGSGFAKGSFMDTGYGDVIGAGMSSGSKSYRKKGCGQIASLPPRENLNEYPQVAVEGGRMHNGIPVQDNIALKRTVGGRKKKSGAGFNEFKNDLGKFDFNKIKDWVGLAKPPNEMKKLLNQVQLQRLKPNDKVVEKSQMNSIIGGAGYSAGKKRGGAGYSAGSVMPVGKVPVMGSGDGRKKRAEIVKKVMAVKGLKMSEASKYVKQHNLY